MQSEGDERNSFPKLPRQKAMWMPKDVTGDLVSAGRYLEAFSHVRALVEQALLTKGPFGADIHHSPAWGSDRVFVALAGKLQQVLRRRLVEISMEHEAAVALRVDPAQA